MKAEGRNEQRTPQSKARRGDESLILPPDQRPWRNAERIWSEGGRLGIGHNMGDSVAGLSLWLGMTEPIGCIGPLAVGDGDVSKQHARHQTAGIAANAGQPR
ncbi:hypothetical protein E4U15_007765 [Claviceps sp. LM218 group G6]|nr:hypothetical protein E4U15_007765 [Claviceps sp. LM218 group G6]